jgi:hypothetical protein
MDRSDLYLKSVPHDVMWGGWRSTTIHLQQAGWLLAAEEDQCFESVRLALRHDKFGLRGLSQRLPYKYFRRSPLERPERLTFVIEFMASAIVAKYHSFDPPNFSAFHPIDATPQLVRAREGEENMDDFNIFAVPLARTEEIIVDPNDVMAMLDRIKAVQSPEQAAIRERNRQRARDAEHWEPQPQQVFHAQILSFAR